MIHNNAIVIGIVVKHTNSTLTGHQLCQHKGEEIGVTNQAASGILQTIPPKLQLAI